MEARYNILNKEETPMKSQRRRTVIQRAMRRSHAINLARHCGLCKRGYKRCMVRLYKEGQLETY